MKTCAKIKRLSPPLLKPASAGFLLFVSFTLRPGCLLWECDQGLFVPGGVLRDVYQRRHTYAGSSFLNPEHLGFRVRQTHTNQSNRENGQWIFDLRLDMIPEG